MRLRDTIKALLVRPVAFQPVLARICNSATAGLMLSQALYWSERTQDTAGWFYKTQSDWQEEICLSRHEQDGARKVLRGLGFWQEERRGVPAQLYFRVDLDKLALVIAQFAENRQSRLPESGPLDRQEAANQSAENRQARAPKTSKHLEEAETTQRLLPEITAVESAAASAAPAALVSIPLNDGSEYPITRKQIDEWAAIYPAVNVLQEMRKMRGWALANPRNRKTQQGILRSVNRWLCTAQDEAPVQREQRSEATVGTHREAQQPDDGHDEARARFLVEHEDGWRRDRGQAAWYTCVEYLKKRINPHSFDTWIKPLRFLCMDEQGVIYVDVPTPEFKHAGTKYRDVISEALATLQGVTDVQFVCFAD